MNTTGFNCSDSQGSSLLNKARRTFFKSSIVDANIHNVRLPTIEKRLTEMAVPESAIIKNIGVELEDLDAVE